MTDKSKPDIFNLEALSSELIADLPETFLQDDSLETNSEKYVVFQINEENYAVPSAQVSEVVRMLPLTAIPNLPAWFLGIGNLRGDIVSVIDIAEYWKMEQGQTSQKSKLIVLRSEGSDSNVALRVDRLREVVSLSAHRIEAQPDGEPPYMVGIARSKSFNINVLDPSKIITSLTLR